jgi:hypothetical protein
MRRVICTSSKRSERASEDLIRRYGGHAAMIDGTIAQHAGCAIRRMTHNLAERRKWPRRQRISWTKDHECGPAKSGSYMRRPCIIGYKQIDKTQNGDKLGEFGLAGEHHGVIVHAAAYVKRNLLFSSRTDQENFRTAFVNKSIRKSRIVVSRPPLGPTIDRTGTKSNQWVAIRCSSYSLAAKQITRGNLAALRYLERSIGLCIQKTLPTIKKPFQAGNDIQIIEYFVL